MPPIEATTKPLLELARPIVCDWRCIGEATIDFRGPNAGSRQHTVLLGRCNGAGMTSLIHALALALEFHDPLDPEAEIRKVTKIRPDESGQERLTKELVPKAFPWPRVFVAGYGVNRGARHRENRPQYDRRVALRSLFSDDTTLLDPEATLRAIKLADLEHPERKLLASVKRQLRKLLGLGLRRRPGGGELDALALSIMVILCRPPAVNFGNHSELLLCEIRSCVGTISSSAASGVRARWTTRR